MLLALAKRRLEIAERLARLIPDRRDPTRITYSLADMIRSSAGHPTTLRRAWPLASFARVFAICRGYQDADDLNALRTDPAYRPACGRLPDSRNDLCSLPTLSQLENALRLRDVTRLRADPERSESVWGFRSV